MKKLRYVLELGIVRLAYLCIPLMPRGVVVRLAHALGSMGFVIAAAQRGVGMANLDVVFGDEIAPEDKRRLLKRSFQVFALLLLDTFWFSRNSHERTLKYVEFREGSDRYFRDGACVSLTAHIGNWEILGQAIAAHGTPLMSIATPLKNPWVDKLFIEQRERTGQKIVPREGALRALMRALKDGRKVALLLDQNTWPIDGGIFVDFFELPVPVSPAGAMLARRTVSRVYFILCLPQPNGSYWAVPGGEISASDCASQDDASLTRQILQFMETAIRKYPECWLWTYRRWKYIPPGRDADGYPPYAHPIGPRRMPKSAQ